LKPIDKYQLIKASLCENTNVKKWIKIFIVWLIAIAIPAQGVASVAMMNCGQTPHSFEKALEVHQHDMQHNHDTAHAHSHDAAEVDDQASHGKTNTKHACAHCVKCTNCCSGFTFQSTPTHLHQQLSLIEAKFNDHRQLFKGFIPSGLERPPRPSLVKTV
jgi:hypothetical protein